MGDKSIIKQHSVSSFDESKANRMLADRLEENDRIKTFFKENDKTPNYDGTFEIIENERIPKKQFIVQIKKVNKLTEVKSGKHKNMFRYDHMETAFLAYVKNRVTESPAIYFVIDMSTRNIYYKYLSDEVLSSIDFENKEVIKYWFDKSDELDENSFYHRMIRIANERNKNYYMGSKSEIGDIQEEVYWLNELLDGDFLKIKKSVYPNLWRFGISSSALPNAEIQYLDAENKTHVINSRKTHAYGIYPQTKGELDWGLRKFSGDELFPSIDFTGDKTVKDYVKDIMHRIIKEFCVNPPVDLLPDNVLMEIIDSKTNDNLMSLFEISGRDVEENFYNFCKLLGFTYHILTESALSEREEKIKKDLYYDAQIDFSNPKWIKYKSDINGYAKTTDGEDYDGMFRLLSDYISVENLNYFYALKELKKRNITGIEKIWDYELTDPFLDKDNYINTMRSTIVTWISKLPHCYEEFYNNVFDNDKYRYYLNAVYSLNYEWDDSAIGWIVDNVREYKSDSNIRIKYSDEEISLDITDNDIQNGLIRTISSVHLCDFVHDSDRHLYYDGIRCWLYQGICSSIGIKADGIVINHMKRKLF